MVRFIWNSLLCTISLAMLTAPPATAQTAQQCDPVVYQSAEPNCWGQYSAHVDFTTEFDVYVDRVWQGSAQEDASYILRWTYVTRQDTGQQLIFKDGWATGYENLSKHYSLDVGAAYRVRAGHGYGYVYVRQPVGGKMTWVETACGLERREIFCLP